MEKNNSKALAKVKEMILELAKICKNCQEEHWISEDGRCGGTRNAAESQLDEFIAKYSK